MVPCLYRSICGDHPSHHTHCYPGCGLRVAGGGQRGGGKMGGGKMGGGKMDSGKMGGGMNGDD